MKRLAKYILVIVVLALLGYKSVYVKKLSEVKKTSDEKFDASGVAQMLWNEKIPSKIDSAVDLSVLMKAVAAEKEAALNKYSNTLSVGNYRYAIIKTKGTVFSSGEDETQLILSLADSTVNAVLATEYIYGNAVRDASGLVNLNDFTNSTDLNNVSEELNSIIRKKVIPPFKTLVKKGEKVNIVAAVELNKEHIKWNGLELIPLRLQIVQ